MPRKTMILAQVFITFMMATIMSGYMSAVMIGLTPEMLAAWPRQILTAWPVAFIVTQFVGPFSFFLAGKLTGVQKRG